MPQAIPSPQKTVIVITPAHATHEQALMASDLTTRHQRYYLQGWVRFLQGAQPVLHDRFVMDASGNLTECEALALVLDADELPALHRTLSERFHRQFYSGLLQRGV